MFDRIYLGDRAIKKIEFDYILIAVANEKAVRGIEEYLKQFQIIKEKIVTL